MAVVKKDGYVYVSRTYKQSRKATRETSEITRKKLKARKIPDGVPVGNVHVSLGQTINMGNFNSVKIDVGVTFPAVREEVPEAYEAALKFCQDKLAENVTEVLEAKEGK